MFKIFVLLTLTTIIAISEAGLSANDPFYCYSTDPIRPQNGMFSTHVAYETIRGRNLNSTSSACSPKKFWLLSRGGTRLPNAEGIERMNSLAERLHSQVLNNLDDGLTQFCEEDSNALREWTFDSSITIARDSELTQTGREELNGLAQRYQNAFPTLLPLTYGQTLFSFRHTYRERTHESLNAFVNGLFGHSEICVEFTPEIDLLLRPIDQCPLYDEVSDNLVEQTGFQRTQEFQQMFDQVNRKLGFVYSERLTVTEVRTLWDYCRFEQGWNSTIVSPWCAAFSVANNAVLEYFEDLESFYGAGYGGDERLFSNMNCNLMQDLMQFLQSPTNTPNARVLISHSRVIQLLLVSLGVFRDQAHLTRHNFAQQSFRQWRTSVITSMATNLAVIQHECDGDNEILFFYNEQPLEIPGCEAVGMCRQSTFMRIFERFLNANCSELFCSRN